MAIAVATMKALSSRELRRQLQVTQEAIGALAGAVGSDVERIGHQAAATREFQADLSVRLERLEARVASLVALSHVTWWDRLRAQIRTWTDGR